MVMIACGLSTIPTRDSEDNDHSEEATAKTDFMLTPAAGLREFSTSAAGHSPLTPAPPRRTIAAVGSEVAPSHGTLQSSAVRCPSSRRLAAVTSHRQSVFYMLEEAPPPSYGAAFRN